MMIDWEHNFTNWLQRQQEKAHENGFDYIVVIADDEGNDEDDPTFSPEVRCGYITEPTEEYRSMENAQVLDARPPEGDPDGD